MKPLRRSQLLYAMAATLLGTGTATAQEASVGGPLDAVSFMNFREIGPAVVGGRVSDLAVDEDETRVIYVGTATAGVWKSTNHGITWEAIFTDQSTSSVGDVTLAPSNPNIVWVGTGEPQNRQSSPWGDGVFKSVDGGRSWHHMGLRETLHISRIQIHPRNPDIVYVAAVGGLWGPNPERGVFKTTDGGETWEHVLSVDDHTGAIDLVMDPGDPNTLFAAMYQRQRTAFGFHGGGPGSGIYRTFDGGRNWTLLEEGLPSAEKGRIGLDIYRGDGNLVYAIVEAVEGQGVYRSTDRGDTWEFMSDNNPRPMYYSQIWIDPNNPERIYTGGSDLMRSDDGGRSFTNDGARNVHLDHHALWIDPSDSDHILIGSDGGVSVSWDGSESWRFYDNLPIAQFYEIGFNRESPYTVCGGLQDNGSWCGPTNTLDSQGIRNADWYNVGGGDGFYVQIDPVDPTILFSESQNGRIGRLDLKTGERVYVQPTPRFDQDEGSLPIPDPGDDAPDEDDRIYRANWNAPLLISKHDRNTVYFGTQKLLRTQDRGLSWKEISPDLTFNIDRTQLPIMGVLASEETLSLNDGVSYYSTLTTVGESPMNADVLYTGADDGRLMGTRDGGTTWTDLTANVPGLPANTYVSRIAASAHQEGRVYATFDGHYTADFAPYVYRSDDYGSSWTRITNGLPDWSVNVIIEHPDAQDLLFLGNEVGVFVSLDRGGSWHRLQHGMPVVPVDDLHVHPDENDLVVGTHGRGIWIMDDVTPLEELARSPTLVDGPHLYGIGRVVDWRSFRVQEWTAQGEFRLRNPPNGARIRYWIPEGGAEDEGSETATEDRGGDRIDLQIMTATGEKVRTLQGPGTPGAHEIFWDFRIEPAYEARGGGGGWRGGFFGGGSPQGPKVLPGVYQVQMDHGGTTALGDMVVRLDPRLQVERSDLMSRQEALMSAYHLAKPNYEAGQALRRVSRQLDDIDELLDEASEAPEQIAAEMDALREHVTDLDDDLDDLGAGSLQFRIEGSTTRPSEDVLQLLDDAWEGIGPVIERINEVVTERMPALYRMLNDAGVRADPGEPVAIPARRGGGGS
jgi:photosystem II stability/assembly factor-like uncharacterized protein